MGPKNPNFDLTIKTGLYHRHCGDYQNPFPMTIHESKSELKQLRYIENYAKRVNTLLEAITFDSIVGFLISLVLGKLNIQRFLETQRST